MERLREREGEREGEGDRERRIESYSQRYDIFRGQESSKER